MAQAAESKVYVSGTDGRPAQPKVAVENVCAWPLLLAPKGDDVIAILFNQPSHGRMIGDVEAWKSQDAGSSWQKLGTVAPHDEGAPNNRMNHAAGIAENSDLVALVAGWTLKDEPNELGPYQVDKNLPPRVSRSTDGGRTWKVTESFPPTCPEGHIFTPHGYIVRGKDGQLRVAAYTSPPDKQPRRVYVVSSDDDGKTWKDPIAIDPKAALNETSLWTDGQGRWLAAARGTQTEIYESTDEAKTWKHLGAASVKSAVPAQIIALSDGRLLLSNGNRTKDDEHCEVRVSDDGGKSWSEPVRVVDFITYDGGYPSTVELPGGRMVTAYYAKKTAYHEGYHMGAVTWDLNKTFPKSTVKKGQ